MTTSPTTTEPAMDPSEVANHVGANPDGPAPDGRRRWPTTARVTVALLALATLASLGLWRMASADASADVRAAAVAFATQLTTWDAAEGLDQTTEALRAMGTGEFLDEVDDVLGGDIRATAEAVGASSVGEVIESFADDRGIAIVIVEQSITVDGVTQIQEQIARLELVLVDGTWKISRVELLNAPTLAQEATS